MATGKSHRRTPRLLTLQLKRGVPLIFTIWGCETQIRCELASKRLFIFPRRIKPLAGGAEKVVSLRLVPIGHLEVRHVANNVDHIVLRYIHVPVGEVGCTASRLHALIEGSATGNKSNSPRRRDVGISYPHIVSGIVLEYNPVAIERGSRNLRVGGSDGDLVGRHSCAGLEWQKNQRQNDHRAQHLVRLHADSRSRRRAKIALRYLLSGASLRIGRVGLVGHGILARSWEPELG